MPADKVPSKHDSAHEPPSKAGADAAADASGIVVDTADIIAAIKEVTQDKRILDLLPELDGDETVVAAAKKIIDLVSLKGGGDLEVVDLVSPLVDILRTGEFATSTDTLVVGDIYSDVVTEVQSCKGTWRYTIDINEETLESKVLVTLLDAAGAPRPVKGWAKTVYQTESFSFGILDKANLFNDALVPAEALTSKDFYKQTDEEPPEDVAEDPTYTSKWASVNMILPMPHELAHAGKAYGLLVGTDSEVSYSLGRDADGKVVAVKFTTTNPMGDAELAVGEDEDDDAGDEDDDASEFKGGESDEGDDADYGEED